MFCEEVKVSCVLLIARDDRRRRGVDGRHCASERASAVGGYCAVEVYLYLVLWRQSDLERSEATACLKVASNSRCQL